MGKSMPFSTWPEADQRMWLDLTLKGGPFDDLGALSSLRETTLLLNMGTYGRWLEWLRLNAPEVLAELPAARANLNRLHAWLRQEPALSLTSQLMYFNGARRVLSAAFPDTDWSSHRRFGQRLARAAGRGNPARKRGRILSSRVLLEAGLRYAYPSLECPDDPFERSKRQRDGTMVAFLAMLPLRHRAFAGLRIGQSLLRTGDTLTIALPEALTKTGVAWETEVPEPVASALRLYLIETRPSLMARMDQHHDCLWVGDKGQPMSYSSIGHRIPDITERLTGVRIPAHFFRDSAATTMARESPASAKMIGSLLAHSTSRTAEAHYIQAGSIEVGREHAQMLKKLKEKL